VPQSHIKLVSESKILINAFAYVIIAEAGKTLKDKET
jgi:hypothetical protein